MHTFPDPQLQDGRGVWETGLCSAHCGCQQTDLALPSALPQLGPLMPRQLGHGSPLPITMHRREGEGIGSGHQLQPCSSLEYSGEVTEPSPGLHGQPGSRETGVGPWGRCTVTEGEGRPAAGLEANHPRSPDSPWAPWTNLILLLKIYTFS